MIENLNDSAVYNWNVNQYVSTRPTPFSAYGSETFYLGRSGAYTVGITGSRDRNKTSYPRGLGNTDLTGKYSISKWDRGNPGVDQFSWTTYDSAGSSDPQQRKVRTVTSGSMTYAIVDSMRGGLALTMDVADTNARRSFYNAFGDAVRDASLLPSIVEIREIGSLFTSKRAQWDLLTGKYFRNVESRFRGSNILRAGRESRRASQFGKVLNDLYLEYQFGVRPLIKDIEGIRKFLTGTSNQLSKFTVKGYAPVSGSSDEFTSGYIINAGFTDLLFSVRKAVNDKFSVQYVAEQELKSPRTGMERLGLSKADLPLAIWDLVPWSFVVDYFLGISDTLNALSLPETRVIWAYQGQKRRVTNFFEVTPLPATYPQGGSAPMLPGGPRTFVMNYIGYTRNPSTYPAIPLPRLSLDLGVRQWGNLFALSKVAERLRGLQPQRVLHK